MTDGPDRWHRWLLDGRFGGDAAYREKNLTEFLYPIRDAVLDKAQLRPGDSLLDVGTGDGLIAFGVLERLGPASHVIFTDISQDMLDHCRMAAAAEGLLDRCSFLLAPADSLIGMADASVDVLTTSRRHRSCHLRAAPRPPACSRHSAPPGWLRRQANRRSHARRVGRQGRFSCSLPELASGLPARPGRGPRTGSARSPRPSPR